MDLSRQEASFKTKYNSKLLGIMRVFKQKYQLIAGAFPEVVIEHHYITKCDVPPNDDADPQRREGEGEGQ